MHLLYLDDSGSAPNAREEYLVLGGVAVHETQALWITRELDRLAASLCPSDPDSVEFHASEIFSGRKPPWDSLSKLQRKQIIRDVLALLCRSAGSCRAFACAVHKGSYPGVDPLAIAFEDLCSRFDMYLQQIRAEQQTHQCGLIILDECAHEAMLQSLARQFRSLGTRWGIVRHLADTPMFLKSSASRIVQLADHVAYAVFRRYDAGDTSYFDVFASRFFASHGIVHGLAHKQAAELTASCMCPACLSRRKVSTAAPSGFRTGRSGFNDRALQPLLPYNPFFNRQRLCDHGQSGGAARICASTSRA
jgi:hypothetical protein